MDGLALSPEMTRAEAQGAIAGLFQRAGIEEPRREARLILQLALALQPADLLGAAQLPIGEGAARVADLASRRAAREPFARLSGLREFYGLDFSLTPATLIPRGDTECLVDLVLDHLRRRGRLEAHLSIVDLGTGSGAILAALLTHLPRSRGIGVDCVPEAVETARANFARHCAEGRAEARLGNWLDGLDGPFDLIVSNPPYIPSADLAGLDPEVRLHDPVLALDGGVDGLDPYRLLAATAPARLRPGGWMALEFGIGQAEAVQALIEQAGLSLIECRKDLGGIPRVILCEKRI